MNTTPADQTPVTRPRAALVRVRFLDVGDEAEVVAECAAGDAAAIEAGGLWDWADDLVTKTSRKSMPWDGRSKVAFELHFDGFPVYRGRIDLWPNQFRTAYRGRRSFVWPLSLHVRHHCLSLGRGVRPSFLAPDTFQAFLAQYSDDDRAAFARYFDGADLGGEHPMPWSYTAA